MNKLGKRGHTETEASEYIGMSLSYLRQDRSNGVHGNRTPGPKYIKIGRTIRYLKEDLDAWLESHKVTRNDEVIAEISKSIESPAENILAL